MVKSRWIWFNMWLDLYDVITDLYKWSSNGFVPLSLFDEIARIYDNVRSDMDFYVRSGVRNPLP